MGEQKLELMEESRDVLTGEVPGAVDGDGEEADGGAVAEAEQQPGPRHRALCAAAV